MNKFIQKQRRAAKRASCPAVVHLSAEMRTMVREGVPPSAGPKEARDIVRQVEAGLRSTGGLFTEPTQVKRMLTLVLAARRASFNERQRRHQERTSLAALDATIAAIVTRRFDARYKVAPLKAAVEAATPAPAQPPPPVS